MKKWIASLSLAGLAFSISGCTTAVMTYVHTQRVKHGYIIERTRHQVRACLGTPQSVRKTNVGEMWKYTYHTSHQNVCMVNIYFKGNVVTDTLFTDVGVKGTRSACEQGKARYAPCFRHYLMYTK